MSILLKFRVENVDRSGPVGTAVTLVPIFGSTEAGELIFAGGTPAGKILLEQLVPAAAAALEIGQEYAVSIERFQPSQAASNDAAEGAAGETKAPEGETKAAEGESKPSEGETKPADQQ